MNKHREKDREAFKKLASTIVNEGGPAFPQVYTDCPWEGLSVRDYFAGQAIIGFASRWIDTPTNYTFNVAAKEAYELADELLKARRIKSE